MDSDLFQKTVVVASTNPVKLEAVQKSFTKKFGNDLEHRMPNAIPYIISIETASGVASTPLSKEETFQGALNRIQAIKEKHPDADYYVAIEGGFYKPSNSKYFWQTGYIIIADQKNQVQAKVIEHMLPKELSVLIESGNGRGSSVDKLRGMNNTKQGTGVTGYASNDLVTRLDMYYYPLIILWSQIHEFENFYK